MSREVVDAVVAGDLNKAGDEFEAALAMKRADEWEAAKQHLAHQVFDGAQEVEDSGPEEVAEPQELEADAETEEASEEEE
tara:strand:+ start:308 stop:547 length:240 start_codon:yes stop_codon:yes gene_type:complete